MENKTTTELINLLQSLVTKDGHLKDGWQEAHDELRTREPFNSILKNDDLPENETLEGKLEEIEETVKLLKRHKHEERSGDVMIRI